MLPDFPRLHSPRSTSRCLFAHSEPFSSIEIRNNCYPEGVRLSSLPLFAAICVVAFLLFAGCRQEPAALSRVAASASNAEQNSASRSALMERQRAALASIPLPTKSRYVDVHDPGAWQNPFLSVDSDMINLRITLPDANPSTLGAGGLLRPSAARRQELQIRFEDLPTALIDIPANAWPYGRVVALEEYPLANPTARPAIRRRMEVLLHQLNDLGIVVDEWPDRN